MSTSIELDDKRRTALERVARLRKVPMRRLLECAVDEFIERAEDEELLESSARVARRTGLREKDAVDIVREWRRATTKRES
jgi:predicted transcriptional regulator